MILFHRRPRRLAPTTQKTTRLRALQLLAALLSGLLQGAHQRFSTHPRAAPPEACGASNPWSGVVRGTEVVGKSRARALRRCLPAARRLGLNVPVGGKRGAGGMLRFVLNFGLGLFLGGVLGECGCAQKKSSRGHFFRKNGPWSLFGFRPPSTTSTS